MGTKSRRHNLVKYPNMLAGSSRAMLWWGMMVWTCTLATTCHAASANLANGLSSGQLSRIWQQEFPVPDSRSAEFSPWDNGLAPPLPSSAKPAPRAGVLTHSGRPHPAVARIIVPEQGAISYGSGTLIDVRGKFGMVITNWHVVRDAQGTIEVVFPDGFSSKARALKVDSDWDLAALVIWRPPVDPVTISEVAPRPGDRLTICGYGQGNYRSLTGRCTQYYAPRLDFPRHMVELDVEARQGDSGGPIFNEQGELAGVLFGAGQGTTLGSFGGRVGQFLGSLAPDIGRATESLAADETQGNSCSEANNQWQSLETQQVAVGKKPQSAAPHQGLSSTTTGDLQETTPAAISQQQTEQVSDDAALAMDWRPVPRRNTLFEQMKSVLAVIGLVTVVTQVLRVAK